MFLKRIKHITILATLLSACWGCGSDDNKKKVDESYTLGAEDKRPFGGYTFRYLADFAFVDNYIDENKQAFDKWHNEFLSDEDERSGNVYIVVSPTIPAYKDEVVAMTDFVERGNTLFVAADYFDPYFLEMFSLQQNHELSFLSPVAAFSARLTTRSIMDSISFRPNHFSYFCYPMQFRLDADSTHAFEVLGTNDFGHPDFLRMSYGKGQLIIMTNATALSNYFLLSGNNYKYAMAALSYLPVYNKNVYWDDFYRRYGSSGTRRPEGQSMFSTLLAIPQMKWAFWLLIGMMVIWFATNLFRKQRVIAMQSPNINSSMEFTQTISRLYFNKKDNHNIALKMIAFFQDHVRSKYYMNYTGMNEEIARTLAAKTGLPAVKTEALVKSIHAVQNSTATSDSALLLLNEQIQEVLNSTSSKN